MNTNVAADHRVLSAEAESRRYFSKFSAITAHLPRVAAHLHAEGRFSREEVGVVARYLASLGVSFRALGLKYLMSARQSVETGVTIDQHESGFPVAFEVMQMAIDATQAREHLAHQPGADALKEQMLHRIVSEKRSPTRLQYALSQRLYHEELARGGLFWPRNDPDAIWLGEERGRRLFLLHWAVYDSQTNLPVLYLMHTGDTGRVSLPTDANRWPEVQAHLMAQSLNALKPVTIARGFDEDFPDLHPTRLRRIHLGPMYSRRFTRQDGPISRVLAQANAPEGQDWAVAMAIEDLESERVTEEWAGFFRRVERQIYALDPFAAGGAESGATRVERAVVMPRLPFQALQDLNVPGFARVQKFVVSAGGQVLSYR